MQHRQAAFVTCVVISITSMLVAPAMAGYSNFVFAAQADSPGNDYKRVAGLSFDQCVTACDADTACNAFTYNRIKQICFLKSAAAQWTIINLGAITGIRLSPFSLEGDHYGEVLIGCLECNYWRRPGDKRSILEMVEADLESLRASVRRKHPPH